MLKKKFQEKDVRRIRNLITKDYDSRTEHTVGYEKIDVERKEGDIWEENGKTWTIKEGIKQSVSKLGNLRKQIHLPLKCPKCNKHMKKRNDNKMYLIHKMCFDCVIDFEHELHVLGKYKEYERAIMRNNVESFIGVLRELIDEMENYSVEYQTEQGDVEDWGNIDKVKQSAIIQIKNFVDKLEPIYKKDLK